MRPRRPPKLRGTFHVPGDRRECGRFESLQTLENHSFRCIGFSPLILMCWILSSNKLWNIFFSHSVLGKTWNPEKSLPSLVSLFAVWTFVQFFIEQNLWLIKRFVLTRLMLRMLSVFYCLGLYLFRLNFFKIVLSEHFNPKIGFYNLKLNLLNF